MKQLNLLILLVLSSSGFLFAQDLKLGGLQGSQTLILTPNGILNEPIETSKTFGYKKSDEKGIDFEFAPDMNENWNWIAGFNLPIGKEKTNIFFYDAWVGTNKNILSNARKRSFPNDITSKVASNVYHIAFQREFMVENETFLLLVSPIKQTVKVELPASIFKTKRSLIYQMEAWEAKFVHIVVPPQEASVVMWKEENTRKNISLNKNWEFMYVKPYQEPVLENNPFLNKKNTPLNVNIPHVFDYNSHFDFRNYKDTLDIIEMYARGTGWYKQEFIADKNWSNKYIKLNFLGANQRTDIWLNGQFIKTHIGGYSDFHHDITPFLKLGEKNELIVRVDNRFNKNYLPHTADFDSQGGIYREVELIILSPVMVKSSWVKTTNVLLTNADIVVETMINNKKTTDENVTVITNIINPYNEIIVSKTENINLKKETKTTIESSFLNLKNPLLWFPDAPFLYRIMVTIKNQNGEVIDQYKDNFGIRFYQFDKDKGFKLNGKRMKLHGVNIHQDGYMKGWAVDSTSRKRDYILMKQMGVNFIRMSHYPHHPHALHLADSLGIMVWEEIPVVNSVGDKNFTKNAVKAIEEMILRDRNHPSVIMWGLGNEYYREYFTKEMIEWAIDCTQATASKAKELDPFRPTVQAQNDLVDDRIMKLTDLHGRNRYFGWYTGGSAYLGFTGYDGFAKAMEIERKKYPEWKVIISEYGAEAKYGYHVNEPLRFDHSETYQLDFHKAYWNYIEKTDWIAGSTLWNMFDFTSFAKVGNIPHINQKGMMTYDRKPKSIFYYYQSKWTNEPMLYINSHTWLHRTGDLTQPQALEIFSNLDEVEVFLNGKSVGKKIKGKEWIWKILVKQGYNDVKAVGKKDGQYLNTSLRIHFDYAKTQTKNKKGNDAD